MTTQRTVRIGMQVLGDDGADVGTVKEVRERDFRIDVPMGRDVYAPFAAVRDIIGDTVRLNVPSDRIDDTDWPRPPVLETDV